MSKKYLSHLTRRTPAFLDCASAYLLLNRWRRFEAENRLAFLHQVKAIARDRFQIHGIACQQMHFPGLAREHGLLLVHLALQVIDFVLALDALFVERKKQANNHEHDREPEEDAQNPIETLPDCGFTPRAKIAIARIFH